MPTETTVEDRFGTILRKLEQARQYSGPPRALGPMILEAVATLTGASAGILVEPDSAAESGWRTTATWSLSEPFAALLRPLTAAAGKAAAAALESGWTRMDSGVGEFRDHILAVKLEDSSGQERRVVLLWLAKVSVLTAYEALCRARLAARVRADNQALRMAAKGQAAAGQFASLLDLVGALHAQKRFLATAMTLVNEVAARHRCERVSLGWLVDDMIRLQAVSHLEKFDRKLEAVQDLEKLMEEAVDQESLVAFPPTVIDAGLITRTHAEFARKQGTHFLCTVPLRVDGQLVGAVTLERSQESYSEDELRLLWLTADVAAPRLADLKQRDRWWGARVGAALLQAGSGLVGPRHVGAKLLAILGALVLAGLIFIEVPHRLEAPFTVQPAESAYLAAPFDGFLADVWQEPGDILAAGDRIVSLDTRELLLQQAAARADVERFRREADKARAAGQLPDMRVAQSQADQASAQLDLIRQRLTSAVLQAPFAAVVTEGDLRRRIGAPVKHGDILIQVARLDRLYVECAVPERDFPYLPEALSGEIAFASQPRIKFPVRITRIEPAAQVREAGAVFVVRAEPVSGAESWWRPGMGGVAKLDAGKRSLLWVFTHRTVDFLRLYLWW